MQQEEETGMRRTSHRKCCVRGCSSIQGRMFTFPVDQRHKKWLEVCGRPELFDLPLDKLRSRSVCILHFEKQYILYKKLSTSAVPTLQLPEPAACSTTQKEEASSTEIIEEEVISQLQCDLETEPIECIELSGSSADLKDEQEEAESMTADEIYAGIQLCSKLERHFLKIDNNSQRKLKFQKELRSCISGYRDVYKQLTKRPSSQKLITDYTVTKNKSTVVSSIDESDYEPVHRKNMRVLNYDE